MTKVTNIEKSELVLGDLDHHVPGTDFDRVIDRNIRRGYEQGAAASRQVYMRFGKRLLDITIVLCGTVFLLPVLVLIAFKIRLDGGPIFYTQMRIGRGGQEFRFWKFRTMCQDADARLKELLKADPIARREWDETQKLKHDPRITRFGNILRKTSLDELPQMWNVLLGDMSVVGPRPMMASQRDLYPGTEYYLLRPGMTGFWQISERNDVSFASRARYDRDYWHDVSFSTDVKVIFDTVGVVYKASGH